MGKSGAIALRKSIFTPITMKALLLFLAVVALTVTGVRNYNTALKERDALKEERDTLTRRFVALTPKPVEAPRANRIICPVCHGEKIIVLAMPGSNDPLKRTTQLCPVCLGKGFKLITVPAGKKICPDCQGMGLIYSPASPVATGNCVRCATTGLVIDLK